MKNKYVIEKGIPLPPIDTGGERSEENKYLFKRMEVGDSFIIGDYTRIKMQKYGAAARNWGNHIQNGYKFALRKVVVNKQFKIRIWRIK